MKRILLILLTLLVVVSIGCAGELPEWTYPQVKQLGEYEADSFYQAWDGLDNSSWDPGALEAKVTELAQDYEAVTPYGPGHVCWDMSMELWQIFGDNGITSFITIRKSEIEQWGETSLILSHVWLIVLYEDNLALGVECVTGTIYSPSYMRSFELECEQAYSNYGPSSSEWDKAKATYDRVYEEYEQHLEGYFYRDPTALEEEYPELFL